MPQAPAEAVSGVVGPFIGTLVWVPGWSVLYLQIYEDPYFFGRQSKVSLADEQGSMPLQYFPNGCVYLRIQGRLLCSHAVVSLLTSKINFGGRPPEEVSVVACAPGITLGNIT